jgi:outer membrane protein TolC
MNKRIIVAILIMSSSVVIFNQSAYAATSLPQLITIAIQQNPDLKAKKLAWQSSIQQYPQAVALSDPSLSYNEAINPIETRLGPQERNLTLQQQFPYPGKRSLKGEIVKKDIATAKIRYEQASRNLVVSVKQAFYETAYLQQAISISKQNKAILEKISQVANTSYARNSSTLNDVAKAQSQYAQVTYDVQLLEELLSTEKTRINTLLNRDPEQVFTVQQTRAAKKFNLPLARLYQYAEANEELKIATLAIEKSVIKRQLAGYASLPDFKLGVQYAQIGESETAVLARSGEDALAVSFGVTIPLNHSKNKAIKHQAHLERLQAIEQKKSLTNRLHNQVKGIFFKITNSQRLVTLYQQNLLTQAQHAKQIAETEYRQNKGSITQYLSTQATWLNFQLAYQRAIADYWKNLAEMEQLTGKKL